MASGRTQPIGIRPLRDEKVFTLWGVTWKNFGPRRCCPNSITWMGMSIDWMSLWVSSMAAEWNATEGKRSLRSIASFGHPGTIRWPHIAMRQTFAPMGNSIFTWYLPYQLSGIRSEVVHFRHGSDGSATTSMLGDITDCISMGIWARARTTRSNTAAIVWTCVLWCKHQPARHH